MHMHPLDLFGVLEEKHFDRAQKRSCKSIQELPFVTDLTRVEIEIHHIIGNLDLSSESPGWALSTESRPVAFLRLVNEALVFAAGDPLIIYLVPLNGAGRLVDVGAYHNDQWSIASKEPFLIQSMYGAVLGIAAGSEGLITVAIDEGDDGWAEF